MTLDPNLAEAYMSWGVAQCKLGEYEEGMARFRKALELQPEQPHVLNYLGYSWIDQGINLDVIESSGLANYPPEIVEATKARLPTGRMGTVEEVEAVTELKNDPDGVAGFNRNLDPQRAVNYEVGARGQPDPRVTYSVAVFLGRVSDAIVQEEEVGGRAARGGVGPPARAERRISRPPFLFALFCQFRRLLPAIGPVEQLHRMDGRSVDSRASHPGADLHLHRRSCRLVHHVEIDVAGDRGPAGIDAHEHHPFLGFSAFNR